MEGFSAAMFTTPCPDSQDSPWKKCAEEVDATWCMCVDLVWPRAWAHPIRKVQIGKFVGTLADPYSKGRASQDKRGSPRIV